ncbi:MAG: hypothetical protein V1897_12500 [Pseudomonadota bacterium]
MVNDPKWVRIVKMVRFIIEIHQAFKHLKEVPTIPKQVPVKPSPRTLGN